MKEVNTEVIIVGSGAGGATLARELARAKKKVLVIERGPYVKRLGSDMAGISFYDGFGLFTKSKEGVIIYRTLMAGGTTVVSCANGVRSLDKELNALGINLEEEFKETERELGVAPLADKLIGKGTRRIMEAANKLGYPMEPMPKYISVERCVSCGNCVLGCRMNAKWSALDYLKEAKANGASVLTNTKVLKVLSSGGRVKGVETIGPQGKVKIFADIVILAAGGIGTAVILQNSGIAKAGNKLFCDLFDVVYGINRGRGLANEVTMGVVNHQFAKTEGFILSPFLDTPLSLILALPKRDLFKARYRKRMFGMMIKIKDDCAGKVHSNGKMEKVVTSSDYVKLEKGHSIAKEILIKVGVEPKSIVVTRTRGAHPGGTAAIGEVVNTDQQTEIKNLFVADASVLPEAPGFPPILTIIALSKRLAKRLVVEKELEKILIGATTYANELIEKRQFVRLPKSLPVNLSISHQNTEVLVNHRALSKNISLRGVFIKTPNLKRIVSALDFREAKVNLAIILPEGNHSISMDAKIKWENNAERAQAKDYGLGLEFSVAHNKDKDVFSDYISEIANLHKQN